MAQGEPVTAEIDIYHTAAVLMREHGEAAVRADALLDKGDMDGRAVWIRIIAAIKVLEAQEPDSVMH